MNDTDTTQPQTNASMQEYLSALAVEWGIDLLSPEEQEEFFGDMADALFESVLLQATTQLADADLDAFNTLVERASADTSNAAHQEAVLSFLKLKIPNLDEIVRAEAQDLKARFDAVRKEIERP